jgi:RNA polymerase sigma-70 factor (ECF subfamily)
MNGEDEIDDLVQNTFIKVYQNLEEFKAESSLKTWLYRITINTVKDHKKARSRKNWLNLFQSGEEVDIKVNGHFDQKISIAEASVLIREKLSLKHQEVIILYSFEDLDIAAISEVLKIPIGTVKSRLFKAHKVLKQYVDLED